MKDKIKTLFSIIIIVVMLPLLLTLLLQKDVLLDVPSTEQTGEEDITPLLLGMLANEISVNAPWEAIKAQAVIVRTNYYYALQEDKELPDSLTVSEQLKLYGKEDYQDCVNQLAECISATDGQIITYGNKVVEAPYFRVSAGRTRDVGEAFGETGLNYLKSVEAAEDIISSDYLKVVYFEPQEFLELCQNAYPAANLEPTIAEASSTEPEPTSITAEAAVNCLTIHERDEAGYVCTMQVGDFTTNGEDFRKKLELSSACYSIKAVEGKLRVVTKGLGHGVGLSQYGAEKLAQDGMDYIEILKKYYSGIEITNSSTL